MLKARISEHLSPITPFAPDPVIAATSFDPMLGVWHEDEDFLASSDVSILQEPDALLNKEFDAFFDFQSAACASGAIEPATFCPSISSNLESPTDSAQPPTSPDEPKTAESGCSPKDSQSCGSAHIGNPVEANGCSSAATPEADETERNNRDSSHTLAGATLEKASVGTSVEKIVPSSSIDLSSPAIVPGSCSIETDEQDSPHSSDKGPSDIAIIEPCMASEVPIGEPKLDTSAQTPILAIDTVPCSTGIRQKAIIVNENDKEPLHHPAAAASPDTSSAGSRAPSEVATREVEPDDSAQVSALATAAVRCSAEIPKMEPDDKDSRRTSDGASPGMAPGSDNASKKAAKASLRPLTDSKQLPKGMKRKESRSGSEDGSLVKRARRRTDRLGLISWEEAQSTKASGNLDPDTVTQLQAAFGSDTRILQKQRRQATKEIKKLGEALAKLEREKRKLLDDRQNLLKDKIELKIQEQRIVEQQQALDDLFSFP